MNIDYVKRLFEPIARVCEYNVSKRFFGNVELDIVTYHNKKIKIVSDRGEFFCYIFEKAGLTKKYLPIDRVIGINNGDAFSSLDSVVEFLKNNIDKIDG